MSTPIRHEHDLDAPADDGAALEEAFHVLADQRLAQMCVTGQTVAWEEAKAYLSARASGHHPAKPSARKSAA